MSSNTAWIPLQAARLRSCRVGFAPVFCRRRVTSLDSKTVPSRSMLTMFDLVMDHDLGKGRHSQCIAAVSANKLRKVIRPARGTRPLPGTKYLLNRRVTSMACNIDGKLAEIAYMFKSALFRLWCPFKRVSDDSMNESKYEVFGLRGML
jgi:hypothetical protein